MNVGRQTDRTSVDWFYPKFVTETYKLYVLKTTYQISSRSSNGFELACSQTDRPEIPNSVFIDREDSKAAGDSSKMLSSNFFGDYNTFSLYTPYEKVKQSRSSPPLNFLAYS
ncbi:hypothetical protein AVEN_78627-1 [Araneus ventricosus]|uniref:Uncharacterized protein n=1 Tax=Araneus ventricosus TaxID=182803 RepID=A0A4Y2UYU7_ARAVE|nr:hypothetical protein AVEN_78627-1 [Araneus ventricosus]